MWRAAIIFGIAGGSLCFYEASEQYHPGLMLLGALNFILAGHAITSKE